jgi:hypothetical protein
VNLLSRRRFDIAALSSNRNAAHTSITGLIDSSVFFTLA